MSHYVCVIEDAIAEVVLWSTDYFVDMFMFYSVFNIFHVFLFHLQLQFFIGDISLRRSHGSVWTIKVGK